MCSVVSGFGMEPVGLGKRLLARVLGQPDVPGSHEDAPDGFLLAYGAPMRSGRARLGSIVDVAPTVLYLLGLPVARDMDGIARTDLFKPAFTATRPIAFIPTTNGRVSPGRRPGLPWAEAGLSPDCGRESTREEAGPRAPSCRSVCCRTA